MSDPRKPILLRIAPELWEALNVWARDELRSVNAQIEYVLRDAVRRRSRRERNEAAPRPPDSNAPTAADAPPPAGGESDPAHPRRRPQQHP